MCNRVIISKKFNVGVCIMSPPTNKEEYPYILFYLGGIMINELL